MSFTTHLRWELSLGLQRVPDYPGAAVTLPEVQRGLQIFFHALSGSCRREITTASDDAGPGRIKRRVLAQKHWRELAWQQPDQAHLPARIGRFPSRALNRDLYYWLAAFLALEKSVPSNAALNPGLAHLLAGVCVSETALQRFPGLRSRYARLCRACIEEREGLLGCVGADDANGFALLEAGIRRGLGDTRALPHPWLARALEEAAGRGAQPGDPPRELLARPLPFWPAAVWGHPAPPSERHAAPLPEYVDPDLLQEAGRSASFEVEDHAEDRGQSSDAAGHDDTGEALTGVLLYPEWHFRRRKYRPDWCRVYEQTPAAAAEAAVDPELQRLAARVRRRFESFRMQDRWRRRLLDGEDVDIDGFIESMAERRATGQTKDELYRHRIRSERELSVAVLLDTSNSTQGRVDGLHRIIDVAQRAMLVIAEALQGLQDDFALYAFSSHSRAFVDCLRIKGFTEDYNDLVRRRILALSPEGSTRMGAALRHVGGILAHRPRRHRLLLVLTDGRPYDPADRYQGRYALEDTRRALVDLRTSGVFPFGFTIDRQGQDYLPHLFGVGRYFVLSKVAALPEALPRIYARLTGLGK